MKKRRINKMVLLLLCFCVIQEVGNACFFCDTEQEAKSAIEIANRTQELSKDERISINIEHLLPLCEGASTKEVKDE